MKKRAQKAAVAAIGLALGMLSTTGQAQIKIPTVSVGDAGNASDWTGFGAVSYVYNIAVTEVNLFQYAAFLNAVAATDTYNLYNTNMGTNLNIAGIQRTGSSNSYSYSVIGSGNRPVTYVSWFDAARFANWVANGQPTGAQVSATTEDGAYTLNGATSGVNFIKNVINPNTETTTTWWIPSADEWYKAAYYDPSKDGSGGYWLYPTRSDSAPGNTIGAGANQANYYAGDYSVTQNSSYETSQNYLTDGGAFSQSASFYGTYDQGGNVWEWTDGVPNSFRGLRGGSWWGHSGGNFAHTLQSSYHWIENAFWEDSSLGFRVASVPEPTTAVLMLLGGALYWLVRRRKAIV